MCSGQPFAGGYACEITDVITLNSSDTGRNNY